MARLPHRSDQEEAEEEVGVLPHQEAEEAAAEAEAAAEVVVQLVRC